jgi:signal transduction histidine kinase
LGVRPPLAQPAAARRADRLAVVGLAVLTLYTLAVVAFPALRVSWFSPLGRPAIEVLGLCVALFTVLALVLPDDGDVEVTRNVFVTTLVTLGVSNLVFGLGPLVVGTTAALGGVYSFYPWLAARYIVGALFIAAGLGIPRLDLRWLLAAVVAVLTVVDLAIYALRGELPLPFAELAFTPAGVVVTVSTPLQGLLIAVVPGVLFAIGAWLALRHFRNGASVLYRWVALALAVQALAKLHEIFYPTVLGPRITTADLMNLVFIALLLAGALVKVRQLVVDRGRAVEGLARDMRAQEELLGSMQEFTAREEAFRSVVVHELGTPIATLRTFAHVLARSGGAGMEARHLAAQGVQAESRRLQELIARMEELRNLELEEFNCELRPVPLRPIIEDAAGYVRGLPGGHAPMLSWECGHVQVLADPVRLGQALRNVLTNAARYSPDRTPIRLTCRSSGDEVQVEVVDRGPGIPPHERERVLRKFERGAAVNGDGAGLGLYIAARIAEGHGGGLELTETANGKGARVVLRLRRAEATQPR